MYRSTFPEKRKEEYVPPGLLETLKRQPPIAMFKQPSALISTPPATPHKEMLIPISKKEIDPKLDLILKLSHYNKQTIRNASQSVFKETGGELARSTTPWKRGSIEQGSYLNELKEKATFEQLQKLYQYLQNKKPSEVAEETVKNLPISLYDIQQTAEDYLEKHPLSALTQKGVMAPKEIKPGVYEFQQPPHYRHQKLEGFKNALRMYIWAKELQNLHNKLILTKDDIKQVIVSTYTCIDKNVQGENAKKEVIQCMNDLLKTNENKNRVAALVIANATDLVNAYEKYQESL